MGDCGSVSLLLTNLSPLPSWGVRGGDCGSGSQSLAEFSESDSN